MLYFLGCIFNTCATSRPFKAPAPPSVMSHAAGLLWRFIGLACVSVIKSGGPVQANDVPGVKQLSPNVLKRPP